jgi:hypothetical protein
VFTDQKVSFYCLSSSWTEGLHCREHTTAKQLDWTLASRVDLFATHGTGNQQSGTYEHFGSMVNLYPKRQLTKETDALNAFLGIVQAVGQSRPFAYGLHGLPLCQQFYDHSNDTLEQAVCLGLSWIRLGHEPFLRRPGFPSWTWIGWHGLMRFPFPAYSIIRPLIQDVRFASTPDQHVKLPALWQPHNQKDVQDALDTVSIIRFEAPIVSPSEIFGADTIVVSCFLEIDLAWSGITNRTKLVLICSIRRPRMSTNECGRVLFYVFQTIKKFNIDLYLLLAGR